jgi:hypothetical protein
MSRLLWKAAPVPSGSAPQLGLRGEIQDVPSALTDVAREQVITSGTIEAETMRISGF